MKNQYLNKIASTSHLMFLFLGEYSYAQEPSKLLTLHEYIEQVKKAHWGIKGAVTSSEGGQMRSGESKLLLAPTFFMNAQFTSDAKLMSPLFMPYDSLLTKTYSVGISQLTTFGLQAKLHYDVLSQNYVNPVFSPASTALNSSGGNPFFLSTANASPVIELTQNLWSNGFGRSTRANQEVGEAQALASSYGASFKAKTGLVEAETAYWNLALARQTVFVQNKALSRAVKIHEWNLKQARLHLHAQSDVLQAEALRQTRELELVSAQSEEQAASRAFNSIRSIESDQVEEQLSQLKPKLIDEIRIPDKLPLRDDVKAAQQNARASIANATLSLERDSPTLDVYMSFALNAQQLGAPYLYSDVSSAMGSSFTLNRPTQTYGIRFSFPISPSVTSASREGWRKEQAAAEMAYDRKFFEQEREWNDLWKKLKEARSHFDLSLQLESIQERKLASERERLQQGRTTTYQVLLFEQDYLLSQLTRIRDQAKVLNLIAQMKLFGENV